MRRAVGRRIESLRQVGSIEPVKGRISELSDALGDEMTKPLYQNPEPVRAFSDTELDSFASSIREAERPEQIGKILRDQFQVTEEHINFLNEQGGARKLREFFFEVLLFDLRYRTKTSAFISEASYKERAKAEPDDFSELENVNYGVKHRASLTNSILDGFNQAVRVMNEHGIDPNEASLYDLGCGTGKPILIAMSPVFKDRIGATFKKAVGVDYYKPVLQIASHNLEVAQTPNPAGLKIKKKDMVCFKFEDASKFRGYNGVNVVYMYNPFDVPVMEKVEYNLRRYAGKTVVIYNKPLHAELFTKHGWEIEHETSHRDTQQNWTADKRTMILSYGYQGITPAHA